ncbi:MAG: hypothetical protein AAFX54_12810 [Pseudomonadota bacterium]
MSDIRDLVELQKRLITLESQSAETLSNIVECRRAIGRIEEHSTPGIPQTSGALSDEDLRIAESLVC